MKIRMVYLNRLITIPGKLVHKNMIVHLLLVITITEIIKAVEFIYTSYIRLNVLTLVCNCSYKETVLI